MSNTFNIRRLILLALLMAVTLGFSTEVFGCGSCERSPHNWGFCRWGYNNGWMNCQEYVRDTFNGTTDCYVWDMCRQGGTKVGDLYEDCWWTDINGQCWA